MSLNLHKKYRERLIKKVDELLRKAAIRNGTQLELIPLFDDLWKLNEILPKTGPLRDQLDNYISERPFSDFLYEILSLEIQEIAKYDSEAPIVNLTDHEKFKDTESVAKRLVEQFDSLPWEYSLSIRLETDFGEFIKENIKDYSLSDKVKLIIANEEFIGKFPFQSRTPMIKFIENLSVYPFEVVENWDTESIYLQIFVDGFIPKWKITRPIEEALVLLKAFCGCTAPPKTRHF